jgi:hypothetical protein
LRCLLKIVKRKATQGALLDGPQQQKAAGTRLPR